MISPSLLRGSIVLAIVPLACASLVPATAPVDASASADAPVDVAPVDVAPEAASPSGCGAPVACSPRAICPPLPDAPTADPRAAPRPPVMGAIRAWRRGRTVWIRVEGDDLNGDAETASFYSVVNMQPVLWGHGVEFPTDVQRQGTRFQGLIRGIAAEGSPITHVRVWVTDATRMRSEERDVPLVEQPEVPRSALCDPEGVDNHCAAGTLCRPETPCAQPRCVTGTAPVAREAALRLNVEDGRAALRVEICDPDWDARQVRLRDDSGSLLAETWAGSAQMPSCTSHASHDLSLTADVHTLGLDTRRLRLELVDSLELVSVVEPLAVVRARTVALGSTCDPAGIESRCDRSAGARCVSAVCVRVDAAPCPAAWATTDLHAHPLAGATEVWSFAGTTEGATDLVRPLGAQPRFIDRAHRFVAPRAGRWRFVLIGEREGHLLYARRVCGLTEASNEVFYRTPSATRTPAATAVTALAAGESITVFASAGYNRPGSPYTLRVEPFTE